MPKADRELAGHQGRFFADTVIEDLEQIVISLPVQVDQTPIILDQEVDFGDTLQLLQESSVNSANLQLFGQTGDSVVDTAVAISAGLVAQSAGKPAFPDAGGPSQDDIAPRLDPAAKNEVLHE